MYLERSSGISYNQPLSQVERVVKDSSEAIYPRPLVFDGHFTLSSWPSVSLCMIVKNEEEYLAACLDAIRGFPSEIIIVDTGSSDRTVEIAQAFGAKVKHFPWIDDFAAARNASIEDAKGEWVFWLDADDRISQENLNRLKQALTSEKADIFACQILSKKFEIGSARTTSRHLRLFRNGVGLHFFGPIHESLVLTDTNRKLIVGDTNIVIDHIGYAVDKQTLRAKARRNLAIIQRCLDREPENSHWHHHLGISLSAVEDYVNAAQAYERVLAKPPSTLSFEVDVYQAYISLIYAYLRINKPIKARMIMSRALQIYPNRRHLAITAGMFYLDQGEPDKASQILERAANLSLDSDTWGYAWPSGILESYLGQAYLLLGKFHQAQQMTEASFALADKERIKIPNELKDRAKQLFEMKAYQEVVELLKCFSPNDPDILRILAHSARKLFLWDEAVRNLAKAMALTSPQTDEWSTLAAWYILKTGQTQSVERLCQLTLTDDCTDTKTHRLLNFVRKGSGNLWDKLASCIQEMLISDNDHFIQNELGKLAALFDLTSFELLNRYGTHLLGQKFFSEASEIFGLIVRLSPSSIDAYKLLAVALQGLGREEDALLAWKVSQKLDDMNKDQSLEKCNASG